LNDEDKAVLAEKGWTIVPTDRIEGLSEMMGKNMFLSYNEESSENIVSSPY
jgi:hypothetical protein